MDKKILAYRSFKEFPCVKVFTTIKQTLAEEINPKFTGKPEKKIQENRKKLAEVLKIDADQLVFPGQTHTSFVNCLSEVPKTELKDTDGLVTNEPGVCLCVQTADCVPVLLFDPVKKAIGVVHAGWRGTVGLITKNAVSALKHCFFSDPVNLKAVIGPAIGPESYEVGQEVVEAVLDSIPNPEYTLKRYPSGKYYFNLWEANRQILLDCGVHPENIEVSGYCTHAKEEYFFSARREGIATGRLVSGIMLLKE